MTDKELQRLNRKELLELLLLQSREIDALRAELERTQQQAADRQIILGEARSINEVAQKLQGGAASADQATDRLRQEADALKELAAKLDQTLAAMESAAQQYVAEARAQSQRQELERRLAERREQDRRDRDRREQERREWERQEARWQTTLLEQERARFQGTKAAPVDPSEQDAMLKRTCAEALARWLNNE